MLNGHNAEIFSDYYARRSDLDRLESTVHEDVIPSLSRIEYAQSHIFEVLKEVKDELKKLEIQHIQQDTVIKVVRKAPAILSYIFGALGVLIMIVDTDFSFKDWIVKQSKTVVHIT